MNKKAAILALVLLATALPMLMGAQSVPTKTGTTIHVYKAPT